MEIKQLKTFKAVIEEGSYTNAAKKLAYSQSTITAHIQSIAEELGSSPFNYRHKTLKLSPSGERLLPLCNQLLALHEEITSLKQDEAVGILKIAAPESLSIHYLPQLLGQFKQAYPDCQLELTNASCGVNQRKLLQEEADVAFMIWPELTDSRYLNEPLMTVEPVIVSAEKHQTFDELISAEVPAHFIINEKECSYRRLFERELAKVGKVFPTTELWSIEAIKRSVASGLGFTFLPRFTVAAELRSGQLYEVPLRTDETLFAHMVIKKRAQYPQLVTLFTSFVRAHWQID